MGGLNISLWEMSLYYNDCKVQTPFETFTAPGRLFRILFAIAQILNTEIFS